MREIIIFIGMLNVSSYIWSMPIEIVISRIPDMTCH